MFKLFKYMKKETIPLIVLVVLLIFQVVCDLSLPDYISTIVNVGIQQQGIVDAVPEAIRPYSMEQIQVFITDNDKQILHKNYTLISKDNFNEQQYHSMLAKYPILETDTLYIIKPEIGEATHAELNKIFINGIMSQYIVQTGGDEMFASAKQQYMAGLTPEKAYELNSMSGIMFYQTLPQNVKDQFKLKINDQISNIPESMRLQISTAAIKEEYKAIGIDLNSMQMRCMFLSGMKMLMLTAASLIAVAIVTLLAAKISASLTQKLRFRMFSKVLEFSGQEMNKFSTSTLVNRTSNDVQQIQTFMPFMLRFFLYSPLIALGGIIKVVSTEVDILWVVLVSLVVIFSSSIFVMIFVMPKYDLLQKLLDKLNLITRESLIGLPVIRAFCTQKHEKKRFDDKNIDFTKLNLFINRIMSCLMPFTMFIMNMTNLLVLWAGSDGVNNGTLQVGNVMTVMQYSIQIIMSFFMLTIAISMYPRAAISAKRIMEVLDTTISVKDPKIPIEFNESKKGEVTFENVCFKYPGAEENVLSNINFTAYPGQTTAIIGSTGSGKSTLINLIPRFYDVTEGKVMVGGVSVKHVKMKDLRDRIGYVPQKAMLFFGTIKSNIAYGDDITQEQVAKSAKIAQAEQFIMDKQDGYDFGISQGGSNVSGGQRQRLSIARAIAKDPQVYIFDDSFSALDYKTDNDVRKELKKATTNATVIIVAQRVSTILNADKILVLRNGSIVGQGTHRELLKDCEVYREIAESQLSKEELENV